ncbi:hypothetical protein ATY81_15855 [Rhizobium sp. R72]|nr:hypothetical protein ATY81_15855 [Rhizobium sp. R72]OWV92859.1 hypothetical protein ATY80_15855 [Rhizobium sp. R711]
MPFRKTDYSHEETEIWMRAACEEAQHLARPLRNDGLVITSREPYGSTNVRKTGEPLPEPMVL